MAETTNEEKGVEPGAKLETPGEVATTDAPQTGAKRLVRLLFWLLLLAVLASGAYFGWRYYQGWFGQLGDERPVVSQDRPEAGMQSQVVEALGQVRDSLAAAEGELSQLRRDQEKLTGRVAELAQELDLVRQQSSAAEAGIGRDVFEAREVEELLRLAAHRLWVSGSPQGVAPLLAQADRQLAALADPRLEPVRKSLAVAITELKLAPNPDVEGAYLRLSALQQGVVQLRAAPQPETAAPQPERGEVQADDLGFWQQLWVNAGAALRRFSAEHLRVRSLDVPPPVVLSAAEEARLHQHLRVLLSQAQLALLERRTEIYRAALLQSAALLEKHFAADPRTAAMIAELTALRSREIAPPLPDLRAAREQLHEFVSGRGAPGAGEAPQ